MRERERKGGPKARAKGPSGDLGEAKRRTIWRGKKRRVELTAWIVERRHEADQRGSRTVCKVTILCEMAEGGTSEPVFFSFILSSLVARLQFDDVAGSALATPLHW